ncbi:hypothetical protein CLAFUW4_02059 [Fulvia fulva]|uniref:Uncharacterized protein n=1 Tax=Passalora fulva TaxID=5499 RepID=A0A9Q8P2Z3_PASFU|nr:uncharacterized protein CLAFUR5_02052 [Fulvia fulva]KAK4635717.1 hypothetical protein CLAFUR4_02055 [Fulvia fulva]KAK4636442.1 hypothetical protein CLAFUR0_02058 [Fulvia fulva]UJO11192.1 hypothetical protein CLAFUR5_02052 [Fulvia fulva]WPV09111.1 hypothetical protein CLAFUW4_02059 [Fulvia fulva]WPV23096.1 hypothetical protein CLAFUW7_02059 [Fulvia fulva]
MLVTSTASLEIGSTPSGSGGHHHLGGMPNSSEQVKVVEEGPHLALQSPGDTEAVPAAATNYTWSSPQPSHDLEQHIARLSERRGSLAHEAELLWAWLSEKEALYYSQFKSMGESDTPEARERLAYIKQLGGAHAAVWREVTDSHKRIAQLQSRLASDADCVTWRAGCSEAAREAKPEHAIRSLQKLQRSLSELLNFSRQNTAGPMNFVITKTATMSSVEVMNPIQNKMTTKKEAIADIDRELEKVTKQMELDIKATRLLIADLERGLK